MSFFFHPSFVPDLGSSWPLGSRQLLLSWKGWNGEYSHLFVLLSLDWLRYEAAICKTTAPGQTGGKLNLQPNLIGLACSLG